MIHLKNLFAESREQIAERMVQFVIEKGHFRREDVISSFGITRQNYDELAFALEEVGLIVKDKTQKNLRILNPSPTPLSEEEGPPSRINNATNSQPTEIQL